MAATCLCPPPPVVPTLTPRPVVAFGGLVFKRAHCLLVACLSSEPGASCPPLCSWFWPEAWVLSEKRAFLPQQPMVPTSCPGPGCRSPAADPWLLLSLGSSEVSPVRLGLGSRVLTQGPVLQMAYQAWVTNAQTVLRRRRQEQAQLPVGESG